MHVTPHNLAIRGTVTAQKKEERKGYVWQERQYSTVARALHFPEEVNRDSASAELEDGLLKIMLPKKSLSLKKKGKKNPCQTEKIITSSVQYD